MPGRMTGRAYHGSAARAALVIQVTTNAETIVVLQPVRRAATPQPDSDLGAGL